MTDNTFNLDELNELKQAYQLIDEKLDGKEIVTPEQIRTVTLKNISFFKRSFKRDFSWSYLAFLPILFIYLAINHYLTATAIYVSVIYLAIEFTLRILLIRRMNRADLSALDLKTLLEEENRYRKADIGIALFSCIYWTVFNFIYINPTVGILCLVFLFLIFLFKTDFLIKGISLRSLTASAEMSEPRKFRRIYLWIMSSLLAVIGILLIISYIKNILAGQIDIMHMCSTAGLIAICIAMIIDGFFLKRIRMGQAETLTKIITILSIFAIVITMIPVTKIIIAGTAIEYVDFFPIIMGALLLYTNTLPKKK